MSKIKVVGHKAPDTDTTCSSISFAWFLKNHRGLDAEAFLLGEINKETEFVLKRFGVKKPKIIDKFDSGEKVAIVDTNNIDELPTSIKDAEIIEIVDHHKLCSGLATKFPIPITIRPVACTATVIWQIMKEEGVSEITPDIAGIMLSAILSDTLKFTGPTTTEEDKKVAEELVSVCGEDIDELCNEMFSAKSDLTGMSAKDILLVDSKVFETKSKKVRYSVLETTNPQNTLAMKKELISAMEELKKEEGLDYLFFFAVDILKTESTLISNSDSEKQTAEKAFSKKFEGDTLKLPGIVSRKKQIIPSIELVIS